MALSASEWAAQQWAQADLGDQRRTRRAVEMGARWPPTPMHLCPIKWSRGPLCVGRIACSIILK